MDLAAKGHIANVQVRVLIYLKMLRASNPIKSHSVLRYGAR